MFLMVVRGESPAKTTALAAASCEEQVFFYLHAGSGAFQRVLEYAADVLRSFVLAHFGHVIAIDFDGTAVRNVSSGDGIEECTLAGAVAADDGAEIPIIQSQREAIQRSLFIICAFEKGLADIGYF